MSTGEKVKILDYLPPEEKQKVLILVQRLKEETEAKDKYISLYNQSQRALQELTLQYNRLKDENQHLKQQIHNSFSIVSQVRANFHANKQKNKEKISKAEKEDEEWEDESDEDNQQNQQNSANHTTIINKPPRNYKSPIEKYRPPMTTSKKSINPLASSSAELSSMNLSGVKSKQIDELRKEVRTLQEQKRKKQEKEKQFKQKARLVDEIKSRYKNEEEYSNRSNKQTKKDSVEVEANDSFQYQGHIAKTQYSNQKSNKIQSKEKVQPKIQNSVKKKLEPAYTAKQKPTAQKGLKNQGYVITADDYSDVLDMINCHNL